MATSRSEHARERQDRNNQGVGIFGMSGSGKSRMGLFLANDWPRRIIVDPTDSFDAEYTAHTYDEFTVILGSVWKKKEWSIRCYFRDDGESERLFEGLRKLIEETEGKGRSFLLVVDECDLFSDPNWIDPNLRWIIRYGRHSSISWIAICRADVETHRTFRMNASEILLFRQGMLSPEMTRKHKTANLMREEKQQEVYLLEKHDATVKGPACENCHFVALPEPFDEWHASWKRLAHSQ